MSTRTILALCALCLFSCGTPYWEKQGIFYDITREVKLKESVVKGNILSLIKYDGKLLAGGGIIYSKSSPDRNTDWEEFSCPRGDWSSFTKNEGRVIKLASGYSGGKEYLYALTARTNSESVTTKKLWVFDGSNWDLLPVPGTIQTIFGNNAVSSGGAETENRAFVTTDSGILELSGTGTITGGTIATGSTATKDSTAAAYTMSGTHLSDKPTFCSDGTNLYEGDGSSISKGTTTAALGTWGSVSGSVKSLWASGGYVYAGTGTGAVRSSTAAAAADFQGLPGTNADAAIGSYYISAIYQTDTPGGGSAIYAATIGTNSFQGSKNNCLWGYYTSSNEWNKE
jgi:hypothetical protein